MSSSLVSVVIPTFNRGDLIPQTLESVLNQTFQDFEIVVVDDGSTDDTEIILSDLTDRRVRYIRNEWTGMPSVNRNTGIRESSGRYVAFVDSDDLWSPEKLEVQVGLLEARPDIQWCFTHYDFLEHETGDVVPQQVPENQSEGFLSPGQLLRRNTIGSMTPVIRRELIEKAGLLNESQTFRFVEDWEYWLRLTAHEPGWFLPSSMALYRRHASNATKAPEPTVVLERCLAVVERAALLFPSVYADDYHEAIQACSLDMLKKLVVDGELLEVRKFCERAGKRSLRAPLLLAIRTLAGMPRPVVEFLLTLNRRRRSLTG